MRLVSSASEALVVLQGIGIRKKKQKKSWAAMDGIIQVTLLKLTKMVMQKLSEDQKI